MIFFKSGKIALKKAFNYMNLDESNGKYGYIMYYKKRMFFGRDFENLTEMKEHLLSLGLTEQNLNEAQIAFCLGDTKDKMPLPICAKPHLQKDIMKYDNLVIINHLELFLGKNKFSNEVEYIHSILASFKDEVLENTIQFLSKFRLFDSHSFIICNKKTGFKFFGEFKDKNGVVSNGDIRNHKYMIYTLF